MTKIDNDWQCLYAYGYSSLVWPPLFTRQTTNAVRIIFLFLIGEKRYT